MMAAALVLLLALSAPALAARVINVNARVVEDKVVFSFDIRGDEEKAVVTVVINGKRKAALSGDFGEVTVGPGKKVTWDVLSDHPAGYEGKVRWEIKAKGIEIEEPEEEYKPDKKRKPRKGDKKFRPLPSF